MARSLRATRGTPIINLVEDATHHLRKNKYCKTLPELHLWEDPMKFIQSYPFFILLKDLAPINPEQKFIQHPDVISFQWPISLILHASLRSAPCGAFAAPAARPCDFSSPRACPKGETYDYLRTMDHSH